MPNWCSNEVTLSLNKKNDVSKNAYVFVEELSKYIESNEGQFFQFLRPMPEYLIHRVAPNNCKTWYEWRSKNWGCKWDASETHVSYIDEAENTITIQFESPWRPPIELYDFLFDMSIDVYATCEEGGVGFKGIYDDGAYTEVDTFQEVVNG